jgi:hypothetical protein
MSSAAKTAIASNYLSWGVPTAGLLQLSVVLPHPVAILVLLVPPCAALHSRPLTTCGSPRGTANKVGARPFLNWIVAQLCYKLLSFFFFFRGVLV